MIKKISIKTKVGWISALEENEKIFQIKFGKIKKQNKSRLLMIFKKKLMQFLNKKKNITKVPYKMHGNTRQIKIWNELKKIKIGETKSYGEIAKKFNFSPRYVGKVCGQNKLMLLIPCHRVIKSDGSLGGFSSSGGVNLKKKLLSLEIK
tara:strand:- start:253 stop:699 length:447 start_codon:yes stop_codon:yes gene_type:complete